MKAKTVILYASLALNVALLVLVAIPRSQDNLALAQATANVGTYSAVASKGGGSQQALFIANKVSGTMVIYQWQLGAQQNPIQLVGVRDLKVDLNERQLGNLMLIAADISDTRSAVFAIDTDSDRCGVYEYSRSDKRVNGVQLLDLRADLSSATGAATPPATAPRTSY